MTTIAQTFGDMDMEYGDIEPVPAGTYNLVVLDAAARESKSGDSWYVNVQYGIALGPIDDPDYEGDEFNTRRIFDMLFLSMTTKDGKPSSALAQTKAHVVKMLGAVPEELSALSPYEQEELGHVIAASIKGAIYDGATVTIQKDKTGDYPDKNRVRAPKRNAFDS